MIEFAWFGKVPVGVFRKYTEDGMLKYRYWFKIPYAARLAEWWYL